MFEVKEINDGAMLRFEMHGESGELLSSFQLNPYDKQLPRRLQTVVDFCKTIKDRKISTLGEWAAFDEEYESVISEALGGNMEGSLFRNFTATTQMENGQIFGVVIVNEAASAAAQYVKKRRLSRRDLWISKFRR